MSEESKGREAFLVSLGCLAVVLSVIAQCVWFYLLYQVLVRVEATGAMWAAYWTYVPVSITVTVVGKSLTSLAKKFRDA